MYCQKCDLKFRPTAKGLVPLHWSNEGRWWTSKQAKCSASGQIAAKNGLPRPRFGDSRSMECPACHKRYRRSANGRIESHKVDGRTCGGFPTERLTDM